MVRLTGMRGDERFQDGMFSYVSLEQRVPQDHPLRAVRQTHGQGAAVAEQGVRPAVCSQWPPVDRAGVYSAGAVVARVRPPRRQRMLVKEQIDYNLLFLLVRGVGYGRRRCGTTRCSRRTVTDC